MTNHVEIIEKYLNELSDENNLGEVTFHKVEDEDELDEIFYVSVPKNIRPHDKQAIWKDMIDDTRKFCIDHDLEEHLKDMSIILK
ncbi:MAG: hypothetical protein KO202_04195 [Methanobacteriaceae archaeon]|jgi:hypothetical protein|nr:hypothetical protein [Methanobacteriaceae archaeon]